MAAPVSRFLPGRDETVSSALFKRNVKLAISGAAAAGSGINTSIAYTEGYDPLLQKKVADKLGFTKEVREIANLGRSLGGIIAPDADAAKAAAGYITFDAANVANAGIAGQILKRWKAINNAAVDCVKAFTDEYYVLLDAGATNDDAFRDAYKLAEATTSSKMRSINLLYPTNVVQDLERKLHSNLTSKIV